MAMVKQLPNRDEILFVKDVVRCIIKLEFWEVFQQQFSVFHQLGILRLCGENLSLQCCTLHCESKLQCWLRI